MASDGFTCDREQILGDVIADWSCPEINYPLSPENVRLFRAWLTEEKPYPVKPGVAVGRAEVVSVRHKERVLSSYGSGRLAAESGPPRPNRR